MAHTFWPKDNPIGRAIRLGGSDGPRLTVVGVVGDVHFQGLDAPMRKQFFRPYTQAGWPTMAIVVRTISAPVTFTASVKKALADGLPDRPVSAARLAPDAMRHLTAKDFSCFRRRIWN